MERHGIHYDVIVVGAGPAGASAAWHLARAGCRTLLLEKERLGRDKPCGGGLTARAYRQLPVPIDDLVLARVGGVDLRMGGRSLARVRAPAAAVWMVSRCAFDRRLAEAAVQAGADLHQAEPAIGATAAADGVTVETPGGVYRAGALLLATGAEGRLRARLGFSDPTDRAAVAVEIEGPARGTGVTADAAILDYAIPGGYLWAFPKGERWNVGAGAIATSGGATLRARLATFLTQSQLRLLDPALDPRRATGRRIPLWNGWRPLARGRVALLGDAAALADPFFAEGIAMALMSGRLAAEMAIACLDGDAPDLSGYQVALQATLGRHLRRTWLLSRLVYPAPALWMRALALLPATRRIAARVVGEPFQ